MHPKIKPRLHPNFADSFGHDRVREHKQSVDEEMNFVFEHPHSEETLQTPETATGRRITLNIECEDPEHKDSCERLSAGRANTGGQGAEQLLQESKHEADFWQQKMNKFSNHTPHAS